LNLIALLIASMAFLPQWHSFSEVFHQSRSDAFEFLRADLPKILIILTIALLLIQALKSATRRLKTYSRSQTLPSRLRAQQLATLSDVVHATGIFVVGFVGMTQILDVMNINVGPLLASASIVGVAIGFGAQTLVKDVLNGIFVLVENQYDVGDTVKLAGVQGSVEMMTLRRTVLRDADGTVHVVPNSQITVVSNLTRDWSQVSLHISVAYTENSDRILKLLREVGADIWNDATFREQIVSAPEVPGIERVSGNEVEYLMLVKTRPGKQYAVTRELRRQIKECFEKNRIQPGGPARMYVVDVGGLPGQTSKSA
jgi:small-conductance mechanosensitive channel